MELQRAEEEDRNNGVIVWINVCFAFLCCRYDTLLKLLYTQSVKDETISDTNVKYGFSESVKT